MASPEERAAARRATWTGGVARSFAEADERDIDFWAAASHAERMRGLTQLVYEMLTMSGERGASPDFKDLLAEFARAAVEHVLVGGYAVAFHGRPRATKDIDLVLEGSSANLSRAGEALLRFGAPPHVAKAVESMAADEIVYLGHPPLRIDLLRTVDGIEPSTLFANSVVAELDGVSMRVIALRDLIVNKRAAGRPQDLLDAAYLEKIEARSRA